MKLLESDLSLCGFALIQKASFDDVYGDFGFDGHFGIDLVPLNCFPIAIMMRFYLQPNT